MSTLPRISSSSESYVGSCVSGSCASRYNLTVISVNHRWKPNLWWSHQYLKFSGKPSQNWLKSFWGYNLQPARFPDQFEGESCCSPYSLQMHEDPSHRSRWEALGWEVLLGRIFDWEMFWGKKRWGLKQIEWCMQSIAYRVRDLGLTWYNTVVVWEVDRLSFWDGAITAQDCLMIRLCEKYDSHKIHNWFTKGLGSLIRVWGAGNLPIGATKDLVSDLMKSSMRWPDLWDNSWQNTTLRQLMTEYKLTRDATNLTKTSLLSCHRQTQSPFCEC